MSSPGPPSDEARANGETVWHPAQEWLEEDEEDDTDYIPHRLSSEDDDDGWEDAEGNEDEGTAINVSDGEIPPVETGSSSNVV